MHENPGPEKRGFIFYIQYFIYICNKIIYMFMFMLNVQYNQDYVDHFMEIFLLTKTSFFIFCLSKYFQFMPFYVLYVHPNGCVL